MSMLSPLLTLGFVPLVVFVWAALAALVARHARPALPVIAASFFWLALTGLLSAAGFFRNFAAVPPRLPVFIVLQTILLLWMVFFSRWRNQLTRIPRQLVIALQFFRVPVEILLAGLASRHLLPVEMTFRGRNFDVLTGLTALPLAAWLARRPGGGVAVVKLWNLAGLALLTNVVAHGILSAPYPFQKLHPAVDNFIIGYFPVSWLPLFLVPTAYTLHFISLRQGKQRAENHPTARG